MKILAVVVSYYPERELLKNNIAAFVDYVDQLLIWENTPQKDKEKYRFISHDKVEYCGDGINSISHALNFAWRYAKDNGYDYLLTMDQDSVFEDFLGYRDAVIRLNSNELCIIGPDTIKRDSKCAEFISVPAIITSGMLISVLMLDILNGYCEFFSVDAVDSELCVKATSKGYKVYQHTRTFLQHQFGEVVSNNHDKPVLERNYSANRLYGIFRNHIILWRKYGENTWLREILLYYVRTYLVGVLLYDHQKIKKIKAILSGVWDGYRFNITLL